VSSRGGEAALAVLRDRRKAFAVGMMVAVTACACGARTDLDVLQRRPAAADAGPPISPGSCDWIAGDPGRLTDPPVKKWLKSIAITETGAVIAVLTNPKLGETAEYRSQLIGFGGERVAEPVTLFTTPRDVDNGFSIAADGDHAGALQVEHFDTGC